MIDMIEKILSEAIVSGSDFNRLKMLNNNNQDYQKNHIIDINASSKLFLCEDNQSTQINPSQERNLSENSFEGKLKESVMVGEISWLQEEENENVIQ